MFFQVGPLPFFYWGLTPSLEELPRAHHKELRGVVAADGCGFMVGQKPTRAVGVLHGTCGWIEVEIWLKP